jgi:hypothetical protein
MNFLRNLYDKSTISIQNTIATMKNHILSIMLFKVYPIVYYYYANISAKLFNTLGQIMIVYYVKNNEMVNITWRYYIGIGMNSFQQGKYYFKTYNDYGVSHAIYSGYLTDIVKIAGKITKSSEKQRKNVMLLRNEYPVDIDLCLLDNYISNMDACSITKLSEILDILNIKCTHVVFIEMMPFEKVIVDVNDIEIWNLYD